MPQSNLQVALQFGACIQYLIDKENGYCRSSSIMVQTACNKYGWNMIGSGAYAAVLDHPTDDNKVIKISSQIDDDGWLDFAAFCMQNPNEPELQKVHEIVLYNQFYVAVMERLYHVAPEYSTEFRDKFQNTTSGHPLATKMRHALGSANDLHSGNVMKRPNGQLVLTDPYTWRSSGSVRFEDYKDGNRVTYRPALVEDSEEPEVLTEAQDKVLREHTKHDRGARPEGIQGVLLQEHGPWWVPKAFRANRIPIVRESKRQQRLPAEFGGGLAERCREHHISLRPRRSKIMAAEVKHRGRDDAALQREVQQHLATCAAAIDVAMWQTALGIDMQKYIRGIPEVFAEAEGQQRCLQE